MQLAIMRGDDQVGLIQADTRDETHPFSSGKTGFYAGGKVTIDGDRYQVSCSIVKIAPKPLS